MTSRPSSSASVSAPAVGFDDADDDVDAPRRWRGAVGEHGVGLADAGRGAEEDLQPAAPLALGLAQERFGRRAVVAIVSASSSPRRLGRYRVKCQIEQQNVDARLAQEAQLSRPFVWRVDQRAQLGLGQCRARRRRAAPARVPPPARYAGRGRCPLAVTSSTGTGRRSAPLAARGLDALGDGFDQRAAGRAEVGGARCGGVIVHRRRARLELARSGEAWAISSDRPPCRRVTIRLPLAWAGTAPGRRRSRRAGRAMPVITVSDQRASTSAGFSSLRM